MADPVVVHELDPGHRPQVEERHEPSFAVGSEERAAEVAHAHGVGRRVLAWSHRLETAIVPHVAEEPRVRRAHHGVEATVGVAADVVPAPVRRPPPVHLARRLLDRPEERGLRAVGVRPHQVVGEQRLAHVRELEDAHGLGERPRETVPARVPVGPDRVVRAEPAREVGGPVQHEGTQCPGGASEGDRRVVRECGEPVAVSVGEVGRRLCRRDDVGTREQPLACEEPDEQVVLLFARRETGGRARTRALELGRELGVAGGVFERRAVALLRALVLLAEEVLVSPRDVVLDVAR